MYKRDVPFCVNSPKTNHGYGLRADGEKVSMQKIFKDYGIEVLTESGKYYIKYDAGEIVEHIDVVEVSKEDAMRAQKSEDDAYNIIVEHQNL